MAGVVKINITESQEELKDLMARTPGNKKLRVQALYWLKMGFVETTQHLAALLGYHRTTISDWLKIYREEGIEKLLSNKKSPGRPPSMPKEVVESLNIELSEPEGFNSYEEIKLWLKSCWSLARSYSTIYKWVRYRALAKLKTPRPRHIKQTPGVIEAFKNELPNLLKSAVERIRGWFSTQKKVIFWCQDETRLGLMTLSGRRLTGKGVKPIQSEQWEYKYFWLYGLIEPLSGEHFFYEFSSLNTACFEKYLELFSQAYPDELQVIQADNSGAHQCLTLSITEKIILIFQPSYSPEVNPIERLWLELKKKLKRWEWFKVWDELRQILRKLLEELSNQLVASISKWGFIVDALCVAGI